jgi:hypothetical protein
VGSEAALGLQEKSLTLEHAGEVLSPATRWDTRRGQRAAGGEVSHPLREFSRAAAEAFPVRRLEEPTPVGTRAQRHTGTQSC